MDSLKLFMEEDDAKTVDGFYEEEGDDLVLKDKISKKRQRRTQRYLRQTDGDRFYSDVRQ